MGGLHDYKNATIDEIWADLDVGLHNVYNREYMNPGRYMGLYTHIFNFCTSLGVPSPANRAGLRVRGSGVEPQTSADFMGMDLYNKLKEFIRRYVIRVLENGKDLNGEELLRYYTREWEFFRFSSKVVDGIFSYLNRHWIKREMEEGNESINTVYMLALVVWRDDLFAALRDRVTTAVLNLIHRDRMGETIPNQLIKGVVDSHVELGVEQVRTVSASAVQPSENTVNLNVYREQFEKEFLDETEKFYANEAQEFNAGNPLTEYMKKVEVRLNEEQQRCDIYLHKSTQKKLAKRLEKVLIECQLEAFQGEFGKLLEARQDDDLARMYKLCDRVENGLANLRTALERHITREGLAAIEQVAETATTDSRLYVTTILSIHIRYASLVEAAFRNETGFAQALDKAATTFINRNAITMKDGQQANASKTPELLAKYCDQLLRKSSKMPEDTELERLLCQVMVVFKYIDDKDIFSKIYTKMFSKRLINEISASEDAEMSLINKLKQSCGFEYTNRMAKMINDVQISKETCSGFRTHMAEKAGNGKEKDLDLNILVLSAGSWPQMSTVVFDLPERLATCIESFKAYYDTKHNGRKLTWILTQSRGELVSTCFGGKKFFTCTTAQLAVLMLYNDATAFTVDYIASALKMEKKLLFTTLHSLVKTNVLKSGEPETTGEYKDDMLFTLNTSFTSKKIKVDLSKMAVRTDTKQEGEQVHKNVDEDRKSVVSACIVRIMKTRQTLPHQQLIAEVLSQLSVRFKPKVELIKRCIGQLIDKEYLRRSEAEREIYEYIS